MAEKKINPVEKKIKAFFAMRPKVEQAFMTSDTTIFLSKKSAEGHAKSLKENKVETIKRQK